MTLCFRFFLFLHASIRFAFLADQTFILKALTGSGIHPFIHPSVCLLGGLWGWNVMHREMAERGRTGSGTTVEPELRWSSPSWSAAQRIRPGILRPAWPARSLSPLVGPHPWHIYPSADYPPVGFLPDFRVLFCFTPFGHKGVTHQRTTVSRSQFRCWFSIFRGYFSLVPF